jgi:hypothetical protein
MHHMMRPPALTFDAVVEDLAAFCGARRPVPSKCLVWSTHFGGARPSYTLDEKHVQNLYSIAKSQVPTNEIFDSSAVSRWKTMNGLAVQGHVTHGSLGPDVPLEQAMPLATLLAFPLLELVAQRISNAWDNDGVLLLDVPAEAGLLSKSGAPKTPAKGSSLFGFADRMQLLRWKLPSDCREVLDAFDSRIARPDVNVPGASPAPPLFYRLASRRNAWAHGHAYEHGEAYLLCLLTAFFYCVTAAGDA